MSHELDPRLVAWHAEYQQLHGAEVSLELTRVLGDLCDELRPSVIIDLGSGWSSLALRILAPEAVVWSVDTDRSWLDKTLAFCAAHGDLDKSGRFVTLDEFDAEPPTLQGTADIVVHDMGNRQVRTQRLPMALDLVRTGGVVILDDMHKGDLRGQTASALALRPDFSIRDQAVTETMTLDEFGRFAWIVERVQVASGSAPV